MSNEDNDKSKDHTWSFRVAHTLIKKLNLNKENETDLIRPISEVGKSKKKKIYEEKELTLDIKSVPRPRIKSRPEHKREGIKPIDFEVVTIGPVKRAIAGFIDGGLAFLSYYGFKNILIIIDPNSVSSNGFLYLLLGSYFVSNGIPTLFFRSTVGKLLLNIQVRNSNGSIPSFSTLIQRNLILRPLLIASGLSLISLIVKNIALHDLVLNTTVCPGNQEIED